MVSEKKIINNFLVKLGLVLLAGCLLVPISLLTMFRHYAAPLQTLGLLLSASSTSSILLEGENIGSRHSGEAIPMNEGKPLCDFSSLRSNVCEMKGDIRILSNSTILYLHSSAKHESWKIKPHARKNDRYALAGVTEMSVESSPLNENTPRCTVKHAVPAVVLSTGGYMGNMFHGFTDVLIPLFITSRWFHGEVQLLMREIQPWWIEKYRPLLHQLSRHSIIDLNKESRVLCYPHVIVGLKFHKEMSIDPSKTAGGYSMVDFARLLRKSYGLERESAIKLGSHIDKKPRLLIISRKGTRSFTNVGDIVQMATQLGYQVIVKEVELRSDLADFARLVNSCDVLMGVHGAGLTNLVFLPANATLIQIVPLAGLDEISRDDFGVAALDMKLRYLQYSISEEESTLIEQYPRDHPVFRDPASIRKQGWLALRSAYLIKQNVTLDVNRFRGTLLQALEFLHE